MVNHLPKYGWGPYILTVSNGKCNRIDHKLLEQVNQVKVFRTKQFYPLRNGDSYLVRGWQRIWKFLTLLDEHIGWVPFAISTGLKAIKRYRINAIFVTGFPFSSFLVGLALKKKTELPLFLDYRDPWIINPGFVNNKNRILAQWVERICLENCDLFFGTTPAIIEDIGERYSEAIRNKGRTFTFSYDLNEFPTIETTIPVAQEKFKLLSVGNVYDNQLGDNLIKAIKELKEEKTITAENFLLESFGNLKLNQPFGNEIRETVQINSYIPHNEILKRMLECNGLLLPHGAGAIVSMCYPGRMFEFFAVKKPILYIGPDGIAAKTIQKSGLGICANSDDVDNIKRSLVEFIAKVKNEEFQLNDDYIEAFEVRNTMKKFVKDIEKYVSCVKGNLVEPTKQSIALESLDEH